MISDFKMHKYLDQILLISNSNLLGDNMIISGHIATLKNYFPTHKISIICQEKLMTLYQMMGVVVIPLNIEYFAEKDEIPQEICMLDIEYLINYNYSTGSYHFIKKLIGYYRKEIDLISAKNFKWKFNAYGFETSMINRNLCNEIYTKFIGMEDWDNGERDLPSYQTLGRILKFIDTAIEPELPQLTIPENAISEIKQILISLNIYRPFVCFCPGAGSVEKRWKLSNFIEVAYRIVQHYDCVFVFGPNETELQKEFECNFRGSRMMAITGITIPQLAALFSLAKLSISNDSGPMHVSCAVACPTVSLFGSTNSKEWFPYNKDLNRVIEKECASYKNCDGCPQENVCIHDIKVDVVIENIKLLVFC